MKRIAFLSCLVFAGCSNDHTVEFDLGGNENERYILRHDAIREANGQNLALVKIEQNPNSPRNQELRREGVAAAKYVSELWVFDCDQRMVKSIQRNVFLTDGQKIPLPDIPRDVVPPNSLAEKGMEHACQSAFKRWIGSLIL